MRIKFWLWAAGQTLATALGLGLVCGTFVMIQSTVPDARILCVYLGMMGGIMDLVCLWKAFTGPVSLCLAFGSTRREAFLGLTVYALLMILGVSAPTALLCAFARETGVLGRAFLLPLVLTMQLLFSALGLLCGLLQQRFGKKGAFTAYIIGLLLVIALFLGASLGVLPGQVALWWTVFGGSALCFSLMLIPTARAINRMAVTL